MTTIFILLVAWVVAMVVIFLLVEVVQQPEVPHGETRTLGSQIQRKIIFVFESLSGPSDCAST